MISPNPFAWTFRAQFALGLALCAALLGYAYFLQFRMFLDPCPLCILQRVAFVALGAVFLLGALHGPGVKGRRVYGALAVAAACTGVALAARHLWLQSLPPDQVPACGPGLEFMLQSLPLTDALRKAFTGSGECAKVDWAFLGLTMPGWTLVWYALFGAGGAWAGFRRR